ncbi:uncharacterized protein PV06_08654 [Exophiala oligosperma]|uniref:Uncharacterized protein n=1 Tax=Exophiala oligosperma TaxID=215243 RepID=A0A0D2D8M4_9EURO|nr:uncharacterized protein PV06_08654 [Exophiala oligosperma]KIW38815.1 hypothetical protein PV06_08654 [Exophiala oligosperma]
MRNADTLIPIMLGNLRQEIQAEQALLRQRAREGDPYSVFPRGRRTRSRRKAREVAELLESTLNGMWQQFRNIERPFLIRNPVRAEKVQRGDWWGESDVDEKPSARPSSNEKQMTNRIGMAEAGVAPGTDRYYRIDFVHRFIWWQSQSSVVNMLDQVQRLQIRRIERDAFEADELVKRCLAILDRRGGNGGESRRRGGNSSGSSDDGRGGGGGFTSRRASVVSRPGSVRASNRRRADGGGGFRFKEVEKREVVRPRPGQETTSRNADTSNTARRRSSQPRFEYEVVQPGRIYVDVKDGGRRDGVEYVEPINSNRARRNSYVEGGGRDSSRLRDLSRERRRD